MKIRVSLIWKLVLINLFAVGFIVLLIWQVIDHFAASYFTNLMNSYNIEPEILHQMFLRATHQFLLLSMLIGLSVVAVLSYFITKKVMCSLTQMTEIAPKLATGDYAGRVTSITNDEVGDLGKAFNQLISSLSRTETMRKNLVANVAHELRTPLTNLRGELEAIQDGLIPLTSVTIESIQEEILRLVKLVEGLHRLSQIDSSLTTLNQEEIDLTALIHFFLKKARRQFLDRGIRFTAEIKPHFILADWDQVSQVIHNLIQNIILYTPQGGEAKVALTREKQMIKTTFTNSGEGIQEKDLPHIFERFYRGEKSRSRKSGGAGIGLSIVKQVITAHGGTVRAASRKGLTELSFTLPIAKNVDVKKMQEPGAKIKRAPFFETRLQ